MGVILKLPPFMTNMIIVSCDVTNNPKGCIVLEESILVATRSKVWFYGCSFPRIAGSNPARGHGCLSVVSVVCCQVDVSATSSSLVQRSPNDCDASLCVI